MTAAPTIEKTAQKQRTAGVSVRLGVINGLRGIAILGVIYQHVICVKLTRAVSGLSIGGIPADCFVYQDGWIGVNLFFILSGFVLFLPYCTGQRKIEQSGSFLDFYKRRFGRLMPLFFINCLVCAFVAMRYQPFWFESFWRTITTVSMFSDVQWFPTINPALWSLMLEIYFSVLCPVLILAVFRLGWLPVTTTVFLCGLIARTIGFATDHRFIYDGLPARLDDFVTGMILCQIYLKDRLRLNPGLLISFGVACLFVGSIMCDLRIIDKTLPLNLAPFINNILQAGFFTLALGALRLRGSWRKLFTNYPLQLLGMMCYSLYMWHLVMLKPLAGNWTSHPIQLLQYAAFFLSFAALSYRYIEFGKEKDWRKLFTVPNDESRGHNQTALNEKVSQC